MRIAFLAKPDKPMVTGALELLQDAFAQVDTYFGAVGDPIPAGLREKEYDLVISYISPWIVPSAVLARTKVSNVNFHPGPPEYPGIGCFNFALYDEASEYGCTAHEMHRRVDTGPIYGVRRFAVETSETVRSLANRTYAEMFILLAELLPVLASGSAPDPLDLTWQRKPYKRTELEALSTIDPSMSREEIARRVRATYYPGKPAPFVDVGGHRFEYNPQR